MGMGTHKSIVDYLYYSYMFNPVFVRLVVFAKGKKANEEITSPLEFWEQNKEDQIYYSPLSFWESLKAAMQLRGFDPIVVENEKDFKALKIRKMALKTLISECF